MDEKPSLVNMRKGRGMAEQFGAAFLDVVVRESGCLRCIVLVALSIAVSKWLPFQKPALGRINRRYFEASARDQ